MFVEGKPRKTPSITHASPFRHSTLSSRNGLSSSDPKRSLLAWLHYPETVLSCIQSQLLVGLSKLDLERRVDCREAKEHLRLNPVPLETLMNPIADGIRLRCSLWAKSGIPSHRGRWRRSMTLLHWSITAVPVRILQTTLNIIKHFFFFIEELLKPFRVAFYWDSRNWL